MTPASLKMNYIEELKKCGDPLYRFNQYWEFIPIEVDSNLEGAISRALSLTHKFIRKQGGAWLTNPKKSSNYKKLSQQDKISLDLQINKMIQSKYQFINYNGLLFNDLKLNDKIHYKILRGRGLVLPDNTRGDLKIKFIIKLPDISENKLKVLESFK